MGSLVKMLARSCRELSVSEMILVTKRLVKMPSPVGSPGRIMWPDSSPPS